MKLGIFVAENDPSPPRKSYNPFDSDDDALDSPGLRFDNMYAKESLNGFDLKAFGKNSDTVIFHMDNGEFLWEEDVIGQPLTENHSLNIDSNVNKALFGKEGQLYTDKNVTECELPEFVICYKESNIKDIGIDVGVPSSEKLWVQSGQDEFLNNGEIGVLESPKSKLDSQVKLDGLSEEALTGRYLVHEFVEADLLKITELKLDVEDRVLPLVESATEKEEAILSKHDEPGLTDRYGVNHFDDDSVEKKSHETLQDVGDNVALIHELATTQPPSEILESPMEEDKTLANSSDDESMEESTDIHDPNKLPYNSKVETRSITFDFSSSTNSKPEKQEDDPQKDESQHPPTSQTMTRQEEEEKQKEGEIPSNSILHARLEQRVHGESSFSAGMPVPLPSPSVEQLIYSGSISLRSESSAGTTSTRSFAFPVLQTEWNSSPPKMGKAGQRHMKKHRAWVQVFNCCKS